MPTYLIQLAPTKPGASDAAVFTFADITVSIPPDKVAALSDLLDFLLSNPELIAMLIKLFAAILKQKGDKDAPPPPK
jgi:hypothetical protein